MKPTDKIFIAARGTGWICVEKPPGISVHNEPGHDILSLLAEQIPTHKKSGQDLLQPVHRLDKETSGLLLLATAPDALTRLSALFARGEVTKKYLALVHGNFDIQKKPPSVWNTPLSKEAGGRNDPAGKGKKVDAVTHYKIMAQSPHYTLLEIELLTGRKHQIRRHAKMAGHPVTGDSRYGSLRSIQFLKENCNYHRLGLHAFYLEFPDLSSRITITSEQIPLEMSSLLKQDL
ncbi:MAG: RNA pseudouridine synthase [Proteobacteria bacterium]|nr:RNA pseudouridine synthase [Desulfobacula sp.]MBU4131021.1 RNA pseudouridine synthase [Pseudomonadota bacterium]